MVNLILGLFLITIPIIPTETYLLITEGKKVGAKSVIEGTLNEDFLEAAKEHAQLQARVRKQGHYGWGKRYRKLAKKYPGYTFAEIACQSWRGQTFEEAAWDAFNVSWPSSPGHWKVATEPCTYYGIFMARGKNNIIYCSMVVGYKDENY